MASLATNTNDNEDINPVMIISDQQVNTVNATSLEFASLRLCTNIYSFLDTKRYYNSHTINTNTLHQSNQT